MRFLADENIVLSLVKGLHSAGHDVLWVKEAYPGALDSVVLEVALANRRILLTQDKAFAATAFRHHAGKLDGLILLRLDGLKREDIVQSALSAIMSGADWTGHFAIVGKSTVRTRKLQL
jgi:predicted nuclease of predicted toxin-antitoxin system